MPRSRPRTHPRPRRGAACGCALVAAGCLVVAALAQAAGEHQGQHHNRHATTAEPGHASAASHTHGHSDLDLHDRPILFMEDRRDYEGLSDEDLIHGLRNLFEQLDNGQDMHGEPIGGAGDDALSTDELEHRIGSVLFDRKHWDAWHHIDNLDQDGDGLLSRAEAPGLEDPRLARRFEAADKNGDGWLSDSEVPGYLHPDAFEHMFRALAVETLEDHDGDGDAHLTEAELPADHFLRLNFFIVDDNADRVIDVAELVGCFKYRDQQRVKSMVRHLLGECDANQDGKLSLEEMEANFHLFMVEQEPFDPTLADGAGPKRRRKRRAHRTPPVHDDL